MTKHRSTARICFALLFLSGLIAPGFALDPTWIRELPSVVPEHLAVSGNYIVAVDPADDPRLGKNDAVVVLSKEHGEVLWEADSLPSQRGNVVVGRDAVYAANTVRLELAGGKRTDGPHLGRIELIEMVPGCGLVSVISRLGRESVFVQDPVTLEITGELELEHYREREWAVPGRSSTVLVRSRGVGDEDSVLRALSCPELETRWERTGLGAGLSTPHAVIVHDDDGLMALDWKDGDALWEAELEPGRLHLVDESRFAVVRSSSVELRMLSTGERLWRTETPFRGTVEVGGNTLVLLEEPDRYGRHRRLIVYDLSDARRRFARHNRNGIVAAVTPGKGRLVALGPPGAGLELVSIETGLGIEGLEYPDDAEVLDLLAAGERTVIVALSGGRIARYDFEEVADTPWQPHWIRRFDATVAPVGVERDRLIAVDVERNVLFSFDASTGQTEHHTEAAGDLSDRTPFVVKDGLVAGFDLSPGARIRAVAYNTADLSYAGSSVLLGWPEYPPAILGRHLAYVSGAFSQELQVYDLDNRRERDYGRAYEAKTSDTLLAAFMPGPGGGSRRIKIYRHDQSDRLDYVSTLKSDSEAFAVGDRRVAIVEAGRLRVVHPITDQETELELSVPGSGTQVLLSQGPVAVVATTEGLEAIDTAGAQSLWSLPWPDDRIANVVRHDGVVVVATTSGRLVALRITDGAELAAVRTGHDEVRLAAGNGRVYVSAGQRLLGFPVPGE